MLISTRYIHGLMSNLIKKSCTDSNQEESITELQFSWAQPSQIALPLCSTALGSDFIAPCYTLGDNCIHTLWPSLDYCQPPPSPSILPLPVSLKISTRFFRFGEMFSISYCQRINLNYNEYSLTFTFELKVENCYYIKLFLHIK